MNRTVRMSLVVTILALMSAPLFAATDTSDLPVTANVARVCTITTVSGVLFGTYDPVGVNAAAAKNEDTPGELSVACTKGSAGVTIELGTGGNFSGGTRNMTGAGTLPYSLFSDPARTTAWGSAGDAHALAPPATKAAQSLFVYGTIPANQDVAAGAYSDTVVATINF